DRPRPTYDMTNDIALDFANSSKVSDFPSEIHSQAPTAFPDPIYPQQQIFLRAKRYLEPGTRMLFLAMGE
ncbi:unnamed protein product, partial [Prorocentrum cordatum]